ncbi:Hint domain-containing protein [Nioella ostreopsis]|uniref:Hint domain-containing protein n=1 Tax=Nioella ostreopsis TaxID=2448479 RepID=UPI000FD7DC4C|nr:Hint domain-containing protein [Nioella ostreopsis]
MPTFYQNLDRYYLDPSDVTVNNGAFGDAGSSLSFNINVLFDQNPGSGGIIDVDDDGLMDHDVDYFGTLGDAGSMSQTFTGYTLTWQGNTFPIFISSGNLFIFGDGVTPLSAPVATTVTTSEFNSEAPAHLCFLAGTAIATPTGERAVEMLAIGDDIVTSDGRTVAVKFVLLQTVLPMFDPAERLMPVCVREGALGNGVPHTDLKVTADHAVLIDGVLCHAGALVNGTTITRVPMSEMGESYIVYHIETEEHEIILANGAQAETFIDNVSRRVFDNYGEFESLYGEMPEMEELPYPRAMSSRQVPERIRKLLNGEIAA